MEITENQLAPKRPQFLTVLCILSFVAAGLIILISLAGIPKLFQTQEMRMAELEKMDQISPGFSEKMAAIYNDPNYTAKAVGKFVTDMVLQILSLFGVIQMWKLRKKGFYLYVAGELLPYVTGLAFGGSQGISGILSGLPSVVTNLVYVVLVFVVLFDLAFIFMYSRNLKYMS